MRSKSPLPEALQKILDAYSADVQELFAAARAIVLKEAPDATELVYDSYNAVAAAYSFTGQLKEAFCHVAAYTEHVNLGFNRGAELDDPEGVLRGAGKLIRHIRVHSADDLEPGYVRTLVRQAMSRAARPDAKAAPATIVKRVSARKKRPEY
ncbi:MAG: DUF1801 domain-containing protein [Acidobacteriota bacterium]|nr:DUF1801 domain-containing protein [Acidobacteriota bacterium]